MNRALATSEALLKLGSGHRNVPNSLPHADPKCAGSAAGDAVDSIP